MAQPEPIENQSTKFIFCSGAFSLLELLMTSATKVDAVLGSEHSSKSIVVRIFSSFNAQ